jgi:Tol biopolymer transport system component
MYDCPQAGKWAIAVWEGEDGTDTDEALVTCGEGAVNAAYALDPDSQMWRRWFPGLPDLSSLAMVENMQGFFVLGSSMASPMPTMGPAPMEPGQMRGCPAAGKWSIAVWDGPDADTGDALDTCGEGAVDSAYALDSVSQMWQGYFPGRMELSKKARVMAHEAFIAHANSVAAVGRIAFTSDHPDGNSEIWVMDADGTGQRRLTVGPGWANNEWPDWSPDGSKIAFHSDRDGNREIYVMNADGIGQTNLTNNSPAYDGAPSWSPDGSKIAFESNRDGNWEIYVMNADGTAQTRLTNNAADDHTPAWSPDGSKIALYRDGARIWVMNADGTAPTNVGGRYGPAWSPDGAKIAFSDAYPCDLTILTGTYCSGIFTMNADGTGEHQLTSASSPGEVAPAWSPGGSKIAFASDRDHYPDIYVVSADGATTWRLTYSTWGWNSLPAWAP